MQKLTSFLSSVMDTVAAPGRRKLAVLGPAMATAELAAVAALFTGHMTADQFHTFTLDVLKWGGGGFGIFNVLEHAMPRQKTPVGEVSEERSGLSTKAGGQ